MAHDAPQPTGPGKLVIRNIGLMLSFIAAETIPSGGGSANSGCVVHMFRHLAPRPGVLGYSDRFIPE